MKKKIWAIVLAGLMVFSTTTVFAETEKNYDEQLKAAIVKAKSLFAIEKRFATFHSSVSDDSEGLYFHLEWKDKETEDGIYVLMSGDLKVETYQCYLRGKTEEEKVNLSSEQAMQRAKEWVEKLRGLKAGEYKLEEQKTWYRGSDRYVFGVTRLWNGIPLEGTAIMQMSSEDGALLMFSWGLIDNIEYPSTEKLITKEEATKIYRKEAGLSRYATEFYDYDKEVFFYRTYFSENLSTYSIDANTGKFVNNSGVMYTRGGMGAAKEDSASQDLSVLSPEEKEAVIKVKGAISKEKAVATARKLLGISEEFVLKEGGFRAPSRSPKEEIGTWRLRFMKGTEQKNPISIFVGVDAKTGDITDYSFQLFETPQGTIVSAEAAKKTAEEFIQKLQPMRWKETVPSKENRFVAEGERRVFTYERRMGDTLIGTDYITVEVNPMTGKVSDYHFRWKKKTPTVFGGGLSLEKAYAVQEEKAPLELVGEAYYPNGSEKLVGRFVWRPAARDLRISAENGKLLDYSGQWIPEEIRYSDLEKAKHRSAIEKLLSRGMGFRDGKFQEEKPLTQVEFFYLLGSETFFFSDIMVNKDEVYKWAMRQELIRKEEIQPEKVVTKLDFAKFVVRKSGWAKIAQKTEIYTIPCADLKEIVKADLGYFALAYANGFLSKDKNEKLMPYAKLTRGEMAELLMSYYK